MLIALTGPTCAGKSTIANYLIQTHNFIPLKLRNDSSKCNSDVSDRIDLFYAAETLDRYVTSHWNDNFVVILNNEKEWEVIGKRPFALLVGVDAGVLVRYQRFVERSDGAEVSLEEFVRMDERRVFGWGGDGGVNEKKGEQQNNESVMSGIPQAVMSTRTGRVGGLVGCTDGEGDSDANSNHYSPASVGGLDGHPEIDQENNDETDSDSDSTPQPHTKPHHRSSLYHLLTKSHLLILNNHTTISNLISVLQKTRLTDPERLRPSWDSYFMRLCDLAARRSNCMKRRVGAILVKNCRIVSTGYNGTPRGVRNCNEGGCPRCNEGSRCGVGLDVCLCLHAEEVRICV